MKKMILAASLLLCGAAGASDSDSAITFNANLGDFETYGVGFYQLNGRDKLGFAVQGDYYSDTVSAFGNRYGEMVSRVHLGLTYGVTDKLYIAPMVGATYGKFDYLVADSSDTKVTVSVAGVYQLDRVALKLGVGTAKTFVHDDPVVELGFGFTF
ncbi:hypothetical protein [Ferrimonas marina]|uniref:Outer membrane protein beta-barrel domain-containing protein n=1 Tax=Ferrimonas marina TaxID=299255 RepID=A0A1M5ZFT5_9GAMM|nr:hypothetical protein [Ferrimonas marina]SHI23097.1 hypothetical protein SAMN02745129_0249 [Ferrimonas marina]